MTFFLRDKDKSFHARLLKIEIIKSKHGFKEQHMCIDHNWTARFDEHSRSRVPLQFRRLWFNSWCFEFDRNSGPCTDCHGDDYKLTCKIVENPIDKNMTLNNSICVYIILGLLLLANAAEANFLCRFFVGGVTTGVTSLAGSPLLASAATGVVSSLADEICG
uniref:Uncharacterized protein n=1 Tax=Magallana gigas TaxID=29159 RepID=A0A8W8NKQ8_MAGGI